MSGDTKRVLEVNQIDNLQGSTQRVKQETTLNNLRGVTQRVYVVGGGSAPVIDELNVTPSTSAQTITAPEGVDGYGPVNVSAVDSTIDANIVAGNIKKDVQILGVTGSYEGQTPTGTMYIISNGTYNVSDKAIADVQVPTTAPALYREFQLDNTSKLVPNTTTTHIIDFTGITDISDYVLAYTYYKNTSISGTINMSDLITISGYAACYHMFDGCTGLTSVDLSGLTTVSGYQACYYMFYGCTNLTSVDLSGLTTASGSSACNGMFYGCTNLTSVDLSGLTTVSGITSCGSMFYNCSSLTSVNLSSLATISGNTACSSMFRGCTSLTTAKFNALNTISVSIASSYGQMFYECYKLESVEFGGLTASTFASKKDQIAFLFNNTSGRNAPNGCTVHFPSNFDPSDPDHTFDASTLTGYPTFGGDAAYIHIAFDLPATE